MGCSTPGFPVLHHLLELAQTHAHPVCDAVQPSHPLSSPSPPALKAARGLVEYIKCPKTMTVVERSFYFWFLILLRCYKIRHGSLQEIQNKYSLTYGILLCRYHGSDLGTRRMTNTQSTSSICQGTGRSLRWPPGAAGASRFPRRDDHGLALTFVVSMWLLRVTVVLCGFFTVSCKSFFAGYRLSGCGMQAQ